MGSLRIKKVKMEAINITLEEPFTIAIGTKQRIENVLVSLELENGMEGLGEAAPLEPINGENQATVLATLDACRPFLLGKPVSDYRNISKQLKAVFWAQASARCAIEMALLDAFTRSLDIPLYRFLGGSENRIETDYTIDIVPPPVARENANKLAAKGYTVLKTKVGKDIPADIERLLAIKEGAPGCGILIDANQGYTPVNAVHFLDELKSNNIRPLLFEQPVAREDLPGMRFVKEHSSVPVCADESVFTSSEALGIARSGCADVINIKLMKSGIIEALDIAAIARSANLQLMIGCMLETRLALGCAVHFAAGLGGFTYIDLDPHIDPEEDPYEGGPVFEDPVYSLQENSAGIGVIRK